MATGGFIPEDKVPGREAGNSLPSDVKVKSEWSYTSTFLYPSMVCIGATLPL